MAWIFDTYAGDILKSSLYKYEIAKSDNYKTPYHKFKMPYVNAIIIITNYVVFN